MNQKLRGKAGCLGDGQARCSDYFFTGNARRPLGSSGVDEGGLGEGDAAAPAEAIFVQACKDFFI